MSSEVSDFLSRVLVRCLDIRSAWALDDAAAGPVPSRLLVFADKATLQRLRRCDDLHDLRVELLVVTDGDAYESAWGQRKVSGSLARSAWRQASPGLAYFDESCWAGETSRAGDVVRVRRKATLMWQRDEEAPATDCSELE